MVDQVLAPEELLRRASELVPVLRERAAQTEELRRIPDESVRDLLASELHLIGVPRRFGGLDVDYGLMLEVAALLGSGCASTSWCYSIWAAHSWLVGFWPLEAQHEVFGDSPNVLISSSLNPGKSTLEKTAGGFRLSGHWEFSSGSHAAGWVMVGSNLPGGLAWLLVPRSDYEVVDTWFVSGLRGTGSNDIVIKDALVPHHRVLDRDRAGVENQSGWEIHQQDRYRLPSLVLLGWDLVAPMIGIAQGMIDEFTTQLTGTSGPGRTADSDGVQLRLSQASAELDAARALMRSDVRETLEKARNGEGFSTLERSRFRRDKAFIAQLCLNSVNRLFEFSGGHAIFDSGSAQRFHRDIQAAVRRDGFIMEIGGLQYGRVALGLDPDGRI
jgi:3-hydroxy-9,10-secoandrosta-1,3,5(10)-triene-9,17-dione monooxygenase